MVTSLKEKILGVILDKHLTWKKHIQLTENKISKNIGVLYKTSILINSKCLRETFTPLVDTLILIMQISHGLALIKLNLKKLFGKQKQAVRIIFNQDRFTYARPLLKTLNALNVHQINLMQVLLLMHKIKTNSS